MKKKDVNKKSIFKFTAKKIIEPYILSLGFKGQFPQYLREDKSEYKFISFQFGARSLDGKIVCQFGVLEKEKYPEWAKERYNDKPDYGLATKIFRVGQEKEGQDGIWFEFGNLDSVENVEMVAKTILKEIEKDITFFEKHP